MSFIDEVLNDPDYLNQVVEFTARLNEFKPDRLQTIEQINQLRDELGEDNQ